MEREKREKEGKGEALRRVSAKRGKGDADRVD